MPALDPAGSANIGWQDDEIFAAMREYVRRYGDTTALRRLREETLASLGQFQASWASDWTYD
jgi:hypothetical protein